MNFLLLLFALPIATIIIASVLEPIFKNPIAVAALTFAIYLIVTFAVFEANFLIFVILYTILAFISAAVTRAIINLINDNDEDETSNCNNNTNNVNNTSCNCNCNCGRCYGNRYYR